MKPVRTPASNFTYLSPAPGISDLPCQRIDVGRIASVWWLTPAERRAIAEGANVMLIIATEPIPPVAIGVTQEQGIGEDAPAVLERVASLVEGIG